MQVLKIFKKMTKMKSCCLNCWKTNAFSSYLFYSFSASYPLGLRTIAIFTRNRLHSQRRKLIAFALLWFLPSAFRLLLVHTFSPSSCPFSFFSSYPHHCPHCRAAASSSFLFSSYLSSFCFSFHLRCPPLATTSHSHLRFSWFGIIAFGLNEYPNPNFIAHL